MQRRLGTIGIKRKTDRYHVNQWAKEGRDPERAEGRDPMNQGC